MTDYSRTRKNNESESFFCRFTFGQFFALLVLEVFTLFFVFYLGARYGREFLGLEQKPKHMVVGEVTSQGEPNYAKLTTTDDPEAQKIAKDLIEKARTPELKERIAEMLNKDKNKEIISVEDTPQKIDSDQNIETETESAPVEDKSKGMPLRAPARGEEVADSGMIRIKSAENARYSIQVGSYQQLSEANGKANSWKELGYPAYVMIADIPNRGRWYRVRIGGFASRADASKYLARLKSKEDVRDALIVLNEQ